MRKKVLLADDVKLFIILEQTFLARADVDVITASDGTTALELIRSERPNVVLLDYYMPGLTGAEVCEKIKADPDLCDIAVIMVSVEGDEEIIRRCQEAGCDAYITKPIRRETIIAKTIELLGLPTRRYARTREALDLYGPSEPETALGASLDLSGGGMLMETEHQLAVGDEVQLRFFLPEQRGEIQTTGRIVREAVQSGRKHRYGVEFIDIDEEQREMIEAFVRSKEQEERIF